jgi:5-methyltetrahydrofolate--homocysteine methyltransferase
MPNAGLPDEEGRYGETPGASRRSSALRRAAGSTSSAAAAAPRRTTSALAAMAATKPPRSPRPRRRLVSGVDYLEVVDDNAAAHRRRAHQRHRLRKFKRADRRGQVRGGRRDRPRSRCGRRAGARRLPRQDPDRDEGDMTASCPAHPKVKAPLMIDSTDAEVIEEALSWCQGKAIINSINLEDGEERFERVVPLARATAPPSSSAASTRTEQGMGSRPSASSPSPSAATPAHRQVRHAPRKTSSSTRSCSPAAPATRTTSARPSRRSRACGSSRKRFPRCDHPRHLERLLRPPARRPRGAQLGLPLPLRSGRARHTPSSTPRSSSATQHPRGGAPLCRGPDLRTPPTDAPSRPSRRTSATAAPPQEVGRDLSRPARRARSRRYMVEGSKEGLVEDLDRSCARRAPLEIINGPLMRGMDEVGGSSTRTSSSSPRCCRAPRP